MTYFRAPGSRIEHLVDPASTPGAYRTLCGKDAKLGARYTHADNRASSQVRPLCGACRALIPTPTPTPTS